MFLKETEYKVTKFNGTNVQIHSFAKNASKKNLVIAKEPEKAELGNCQYFLQGVLSKLTVKL